nr:MAG TPA: hypothetical protein [Bacteriophage sp.]
MPRLSDSGFSLSASKVLLSLCYRRLRYVTV